MQKGKQYLLLHILLLVFSFSPVFSKLAGRQPFLSKYNIIFYGLVLLILGIYAIFWQQIIKRIPLSTAYANRAITVVWGMLWGLWFFGEAITVQKLVGCAIVVAGVVLFAFSEKTSPPKKEGEADV